MFTEWNSLSFQIPARKTHKCFVNTHCLKEAKSWECSEHVQMDDLHTLLTTEALLRTSRVCKEA